MNIRKSKIQAWPFRTRKIIWGRRPKRERRKVKSLVTFLFIICFISLSYQYIEKEFLPTVMAISEYRIRTMSTNMINKAVDDSLRDLDIDTENLVTYYYDGDDNFQSFGVNSVLINQICSSIIENINAQVNEYNEETLYIPIGKLLGKSVFANSGPSIQVRILPSGTASTSYQSSFKSSGINQVNHRIWIKVDMTMQVVVPFDSTQVIVSQDITMIDRVLNGQVPNQYISVPKDEILNVVE